MKMQISDSVLRACINRMKSAPFKAADIAAVALVAGAPKFVAYVADRPTQLAAYRVADRLIQRQRKAGNIKVGSPYPTWTWVGK